MTATISNARPADAGPRHARCAGRPQPMCGRAAERRTVDALLDRAAAGAGGVLLIDGGTGHRQVVAAA